MAKVAEGCRGFSVRNFPDQLKERIKNLGKLKGLSLQAMLPLVLEEGLGQLESKGRRMGYSVPELEEDRDEIMNDLMEGFI